MIYLSLISIASDPSLWSFNNDDNLIFTRKDFADPNGSEIFGRLKRSSDPAVEKLTERLEECCGLPIREVPDLEAILHDIPATSAPASMVSSPGPLKAIPVKEPNATSPNVGIYRRVLQDSGDAPERSPFSSPMARPLLKSSEPLTWYANKPWLKWFLYGYVAMILAWLLQTELVSYVVNGVLVIGIVVAVAIYLFTRNPGYLVLGGIALLARIVNVYDRSIDLIWPWIGFLPIAAIVTTGAMDMLNKRARMRQIAVGTGILLAILCGVAFAIT